MGYAGGNERLRQGTHGFSRAGRSLHGRGPALGADPGKRSAPRASPVPAQERSCFLLGRTPPQQISAKVRGIRAGPGCCGHRASFRRNSEKEAAEANSIRQAAPFPVSHPRSLAVPASATFPREGPDWGMRGLKGKMGEGGVRMPETEGRSRGSLAPVLHPPSQPASCATPTCAVLKAQASQ